MCSIILYGHEFPRFVYLDPRVTLPQGKQKRTQFKVHALNGLIAM